MTERPNLFKFATSELSQDAFLCWLLSWADQEYATVDPDLHRTATNFLKSIGKKCKETDVFEGSVALKVEIKPQHEGIDVLALISIEDQEYALVIEDKTDSTAHSGQLSRYRDIMEKKYSESNLLLVYLKTGEILPKAKREAKNNKYVIYSRNDLLQVLEPIAENTKDSILRDFYIQLRQINDDCNRFREECISQWTNTNSRRPWEGFFAALHQEMQGTDWSFVNNRSGGEYKFDFYRSQMEKFVGSSFRSSRNGTALGSGTGGAFSPSRLGKLQGRWGEVQFVTISSIS